MKPDDWLRHLSAAEAFLSLLGSAVVAIIAVFVRIRRELKRAQVAMLSVPPTVPPEAGGGDGLEGDGDELARGDDGLEGEGEGGDGDGGEAALRRDLRAREARIRALGEELQVLGADHARTANALSEALRTNARLRAHVLDLEQRRLLASPTATSAARRRPAAAAPEVDGNTPTVRPRSGGRHEGGEG